LSLSSTLTIAGSTLTGNSAGLFGGGFTNYGTATITGSLITGNNAQYGSEINSIGTTNLNAFNLIGDSSKTTAQALLVVSAGANDILATSDGTNPKALAAILAPLANNGGPTQTHALVAGSPAINAGNPSFTSPPDFDQRGVGFDRVSGGRTDIGAFEFQFQSADFDLDGDVDGRDFLAWQRGFGTPAPTAVKSQGDSDNDLDVDGADLGVWQGQYGTVPGPLVAEVEEISDLGFMIADGGEGTGDRGQRSEVTKLKFDARGVSLAVSRRENVDGTAGQASSGTPAVEDPYIEEVDRALEQFATAPSGVRSFGEMVARRGVKRTADLGLRNEKL
jgi:hypothetical protein